MEEIECDVELKPTSRFTIIFLLARLSPRGKASVKDCQTNLAMSEKTVLAAFRKMLDGSVMCKANEKNLSPSCS
jgi:predicted transcriptional regulator